MGKRKKVSEGIIYALQNPLNYIDPDGLCVASNYHLCAGIPSEPTPQERKEQECTIKCVLLGEVAGRVQEEAALAAAKSYGGGVAKDALKLVFKTIAWPARLWDVYQCDKQCEDCD